MGEAEKKVESPENPWSFSPNTAYLVVDLENFKDADGNPCRSSRYVFAAVEIGTETVLRWKPSKSDLWAKRPERTPTE